MHKSSCVPAQMSEKESNLIASHSKCYHNYLIHQLGASGMQRHALCPSAFRKKSVLYHIECDNVN